jgi:hypothetical protein
MAFPQKDSVLVPYSINFNDRLASRADDYGITEPQAASYTAVHVPYLAAVSALDVARAAGTRSQSLTAARNDARDNLLRVGRELYAMVSANDAVSDQLKIDLGVHVRGESVRVPMPSKAPSITVADVRERTVTVNVFDKNTESKRGKAPNATAAWLYTFVGEDYPADPAGWSFQGATTKYKHDITFPNTIAGGTRVWIMAAWINRKQQSGPPCMPVSTYLQGGGVVSQTSVKTGDEPSSGGMKIAA